jgi:hypothetical protein
VNFSICHAIPGRIRLRIGALRTPSPLAERMLAWLRAAAWVKNVRINHECSSLVLEYDRKAQQTEAADIVLMEAAVETRQRDRNRA